MHSKYSLLFLIIFTGLNGLSQSSKDLVLEKSIDSIIHSQYHSNEPGIAILVARNRQIVYQKGYGSANIELNVPVNPDQLFRIGSVTKQFTAIGILVLVEQGKISLQDSIQKYVTDFPSKGSIITIENLLTHTSGIPDYSNADTINPYIEREDFTPQRIINYFKKLPLEFKPGTKYNYSNSGYLLLAYIIEKVTGTDYHRWMAENVIKRAGLEHTLLATEKTIIPGRVQGYTKDNGFYEHCEYQTASIAFGCGDLMSTVEDLYKWNNALLDGKLIKKETLEKAFTPFVQKDGTTTKYGYGWFIDNSNGMKCIHHEGQVSGFTAFEDYFPANNVYVSILTNQLSAEDKTDFSNSRFRLINEIISLALGKSPEREFELPDSVLASYAGVYSANFGKKQTLTINKRDGKLYVDLSNKTGKNMVMMPLSATKFLLPDVLNVRTTFEFVKERGTVTKLIVTQDKEYEWKKLGAAEQ